MLNAKKAAGGGNGGNKNFVEQPVLEPGAYPIRLAQIIDLGVQPQRPYKGEAKPPAHMIMLTYEFVDEFLIDEEGEEIEDKPRWISEDFPLYNLQSERAKSTQRYYAFDPKEDHEGEWPELTGACANAMVNTFVLKSGPNAGKEKNGIQSLSAMRPRDAAKTPELQNPPKVFVLDEPDMEVFKSLPEWLQEKIKGNLGYKGSALEDALGAAPEPAKEEPEKEEPKPKKAKAKKPEPVEDEDDDGEDGGDRPW